MLPLLVGTLFPRVLYHGQSYLEFCVANLSLRQVAVRASS